MSAYMNEEDIEDLICWNLGFGILPNATIKELQNEGIKVPEYLIEQYINITHTSDHLL